MGTSAESQKHVLHTEVNWQTGTVVFSEQAASGLTLINPPKVQVPIMMIMRLAADAILIGLPPQVRNLSFIQAEQQPDNGVRRE